MSWPWMVAALWVTLAVGITAGWALRGSIVDEPVDPVEPEPMQWSWPTLATASFTMTPVGGSDEPPAAGVREPRRPRPQPPHLALVREYVPTLQVVE